VGKTELKEANRRLAEQQERVVRQEARIARLDHYGLPTDREKELLGLMEDLLQEMRKRAWRLST
jgi:hypothetical protein